MIYYLDCEFDGFGGELISMGIVSQSFKRVMDGRCIYASNMTYLVDEKYANGSKKPKSKWVKENVMPVLDTKIMKPTLYDKKTLPNFISHFFRGDNDVTIITDWPDDIRYFCESIMVGPGKMVRLDNIKFIMSRIDSYPSSDKSLIQHNALCDAIALSLRYNK